MPTTYATCPVCGAPRLRLAVWADYNNMLICTCDNPGCKLCNFTITPDVYTDPDELARYDLKLSDMDSAAVETLTTNRHRIQQRLHDTAG